MDEHGRASRLAGELAARLAPVLPPPLTVSARGAALRVRGGAAGEAVLPVAGFEDRDQLALAAADALLAVRDEAGIETRERYERDAALDWDVVRMWFGRVPPATPPPWRRVLPELQPLPAADLVGPAVATDRSRPYAGSMAGSERAVPVRSLTLVGRRTRGYHVEMYRAKSGFGLARRGRRTIVRLGSLRLEWYPK